MSPTPRLAFLLGALLLLLAPRVAHAALPSIALELLPDTPEIDGDALRNAVARELDATILDAGEVSGASFTIVVSIDRASRELVIERRDTTGGLSRRVPVPDDPAETLRVAVFLIGNLARDEASDVLRQLGHSRPPSPEPAPSAAPLPPAQNAPPRPPRFWLGVSGQYDFVFLHSADNACVLNPTTALPINAAGYNCTDANGNDFPARGGSPVQDLDIETNVSDRVAGGTTPANIRAMISLDYATGPNLLVGARLGYVFNTYPGQAASAFPPIHAELRATYVFGDQPLFVAGLAPYAMIAVGASQWSANVGVTVVSKIPSMSPTIQTTNEQAWEVSGPAFGSIGAGLRWAIAPRVALFTGPRLNVALGSATNLVSVSQELGVQFGM